ncbi:DNA-directed RNA polymerase subunit omega [Propioniferax innocua]|uniref:DNA-directed RNA polymerase subunit omega n=1 Tax=Propioniferax innocua TaxID=1753 RepID=UPI00115499FB|nr:DNA-directed RNA polymerase subunit omega [Propioniferax innocua]
MTTPVPEGITNPPIDDLLAKVGSKYELVLFASKRARQINAYYSQLGEGLLENVGPLVETGIQEKPLTTALREINADVLEAHEVDPEAEAAAALAAQSDPDFGTDLGDDFSAADLSVEDLGDLTNEPGPDAS